MDKVLVLITQLENGTRFPISFRVNSKGCPRLPVLPPGETRLVKQTRILKWISQHEQPRRLKIWVFLDNLLTGIQLKPGVLPNNMRVLFKFGDDGLQVLVVKEQASLSNFVRRLKFFGCKMNKAWDTRATALIANSDEIFARELRVRKGMIWPSNLMQSLNFRSIAQENAVDHGGAPGFNNESNLRVTSVNFRETQDNPMDHRRGYHNESSPLIAVSLVDHGGEDQNESSLLVAVTARGTPQMHPVKHGGGLDYSLQSQRTGLHERTPLIIEEEFTRGLCWSLLRLSPQLQLAALHRRMRWIIEKEITMTGLLMVQPFLWLSFCSVFLCRLPDDIFSFCPK